MELDSFEASQGHAKIASQDVKFEKDSEAYKLTKSAIAEDLDEETVTNLTTRRQADLPYRWWPESRPTQRPRSRSCAQPVCRQEAVP